MNENKNSDRGLFLASALLICYFALDASLSLRNIATLTEQTAAVARTHEVTASIERVLSDMKDAETGQRGFLITDDPQYLDPYVQARTRIEPGLQAIETAASGDARQEASVADLRRHAEAKLAELQASIDARREAGFEAARQMVVTNTGKKQMDSMRALAQAMIRRETDALALRQENADAAAARATNQIIISDGLGAFAVAALMLLLRRHLATRERALREAAAHRQELEAADRRKDEFLATLAHELRNPLAPMSNSLFILSQRDAPQHLRERGLSTLQRQVRQMVRLIDDLLDVGRIRLGKLVLSRRRVKLSDVVEQAVETVAPLVQVQRHELRVEIPAQPVFLDADPIRIAQVLSNLLNNAAKFTPPEGRISLEATTEAGWVSIAVRDNGAGIDPQRTEEVFDLFAQLDQSVERQHSGLGIGLALVRRLTELHGGTVVARSEGAGRGAEFIVRLPTADAPGLPIVSEAAAAAAAPGTRRVLLVDDNTDGADTLAAMVRLLGHDARVANDGPTALAIGGEWAPDLAILDIGMPGMNGYDLCGAMRATAWGRSAVIVALTGWGQEHDRRRAEAAGFDHHVVKPIGPEMLRSLCEDSQPDPQRVATSA